MDRRELPVDIGEPILGSQVWRGIQDRKVGVKRTHRLEVDRTSAGAARYRITELGIEVPGVKGPHVSAGTEH